MMLKAMGGNCERRFMCRQKSADFGRRSQKQLSEFQFYAIRLFVHVPDDVPGMRGTIEEFFRTELRHFPFSP
jgi:hypothetical protein